MRRCAWLVTALVLMAAENADDKADAVKKELAKLEGSWKMVSMEIDGNKAYINLGSSSGIKVGDKFRVFTVGETRSGWSSPFAESALAKLAE